MGEQREVSPAGASPESVIVTDVCSGLIEARFEAGDDQELQLPEGVLIAQLTAATRRHILGPPQQEDHYG